MSEQKKSHPGSAYALYGQWLVRFTNLYKSRGFQSLTSFCAQHPTKTLHELANILAPGDVAPIQIQWMLVDEALETNDFKACAKSLLIHRLYESKEGWPLGNGWEEQTGVRYSLTAWEGIHPDEPYRSAMKAMVDELLDAADIPAGWLPSGVDDPRITKLFDSFWPEHGSE